MRTNAVQATFGPAQKAQGVERPTGYQGGSGSSVGIGGAIAVHLAVIGIWMLIPKTVIDAWLPPTLQTTNIPIDKPPPVAPVEATVDQPIKPRPTPQRPSMIDPVVPPLPMNPTIIGGAVPGEGIDPGPSIILPPADPPREPELVDARIDPRALPEFQPDYPGAMIRQGMDGVVVVRVTISPEGRVTDIELVSASDDSFWTATRRHALRAWRFRPATRDGVPVATTKQLTVRFTLTDR